MKQTEIDITSGISEGDSTLNNTSIKDNDSTLDNTSIKDKGSISKDDNISIKDNNSISKDHKLKTKILNEDDSKIKSIEKDNDDEKKGKKKKSKVKKIILWIFGILFMIYMIWNVGGHINDHIIINNTDYGKKMNVFNRTMSVGIVGNDTKPPLVVLPGFGSASPILEFKPIAEMLSEQFQVYTIEPFGYGLSDGNTDDRRNLANVVNELHYITTEELKLKKYYLMAHSLGGLYSLYWANEHPDEILGFIGIDISVPGMEDTADYFISIGHEAKYGTLLLKTFDVLGITRFISYYNPSFVYQYDPNYKYTNEEINAIKALAISHQNNKTLMNEGEAIDENLKDLQGLKFPKDIPVLFFVATENIDDDPYWKGMHEDLLYKTDKHELTVLKGQHYLHLDNKDNIVKKVKEWMSSQENSENSSTDTTKEKTKQ